MRSIRTKTFFVQYGGLRHVSERVESLKIQVSDDQPTEVLPVHWQAGKCLFDQQGRTRVPGIGVEGMRIRSNVAYVFVATHRYIFQISVMFHVP